ncbi:hypothetical protein JNJ66_03755 [Candidatus Saccharibacteria bacterium]|nr:hypothetical protein [Candidatus Saccharibacteria bacterium]
MKAIIATLLVVGVVTLPQLVRADSSATLQMRIVPRECIVESVDDGGGERQFLSPEDCDDLLNPEPETPGGQQPSDGDTPVASEDTPEPAPAVAQTVAAPGAGDPGPPPAAGPVVSAEEASDLVNGNGGPGSAAAAIERTVASWLRSSSTVIQPAAPYAVSGMLGVAALVVVDAVLFEFTHVRRIFEALNQSSSAVRRSVRRP